MWDFKQKSNSLYYLKLKKKQTNVKYIDVGYLFS